MQVEHLGKLERRVQLSVPRAEIEREVDTRLRRLSRTVRMAGFRPGKVPMKIVAQHYGFQVHNEVLSEKVGSAFDRAIEESRLRVAGRPSITAHEGAAADDGAVAFDATFEVYPDVKLAPLESAAVERATTPVDDAAVNRTIEILRGQRTHYHSKAAHDADHDPHRHAAGHAAPAGTSAVAENGDRVVVDFDATIDGVPFDGGRGTDVAFVLGAGQMLPGFDAAALGMGVGETKAFDLTFPVDYHGKDVAGKTGRFTITVKDVSWAHVPEVDAAFAESLGIAGGDLDRMRADIRANVEREVRKRLAARTKESVMAALIASADADVPKALVDAEVERLQANAREELARRGLGADAMPLTADLFAPQAERRVRLGLVLGELVKSHDLQAKPEQVRAHVEDLAQSYEKPAEVVRWYFADRTRLSEVEALVLEENVVNFVLDRARVTDVHVPFDELMGNAH